MGGKVSFPIIDGKRVCTACKENKNVELFGKEKRTLLGITSECRVCFNKRIYKIRAKNYAYYREWHRKYSKEYGRANYSKISITERYKEYRKKYRVEHRDRFNRAITKWRLNNKEKMGAHTIVNNAIKLGKILRQNCTVCNEPKAHAHHENYKRPLDVIWYCRIHHMERHRQIRKERENQIDK